MLTPTSGILIVSRCRLQVPGVSSSSSPLSTFKKVSASTAPKKFETKSFELFKSKFLRSSVPGQIANLIKTLRLPERARTHALCQLPRTSSSLVLSVDSRPLRCITASRWLSCHFPPPSITAFVRSLWKEKKSNYQFPPLERVLALEHVFNSGLRLVLRGPVITPPLSSARSRRRLFTLPDDNSHPGATLLGMKCRSS